MKINNKTEIQERTDTMKGWKKNFQKDKVFRDIKQHTVAMNLLSAMQKEHSENMSSKFLMTAEHST